VCCSGFDDQQWYQQLFDYGMAASSGEGDPDEELIPRLVRELVLPRALHTLGSVWNPASRRQTKAAAAMVSDLLVYVPADDPKMQVMPAFCCALHINIHMRVAQLDHHALGRIVSSSGAQMFPSFANALPVQCR
jgi:hypothetical protein